MYSIRFDMRAPAIGAVTTDLYATAIDMCAWAEEHGCIAAVLCEHHGSLDGYLPTPLILASAIAARTSRLALNVIRDKTDRALGLKDGTAEVDYDNAAMAHTSSVRGWAKLPVTVG